MSEIIGFVGMSHSPFATLLPPGSPADKTEAQITINIPTDTLSADC